MSQVLLDSVKNASPFYGSKPRNLRDRVLAEADREHRDHNYSLVRQGLTRRMGSTRIPCIQGPSPPKDP